jgi:hypothetical protein
VTIKSNHGRSHSEIGLTVLIQPQYPFAELSDIKYVISIGRDKISPLFEPWRYPKLERIKFAFVVSSSAIGNGAA